MKPEQENITLIVVTVFHLKVVKVIDIQASINSVTTSHSCSMKSAQIVKLFEVLMPC